MASDKKFGRNKRSPAAKRYLAEARWNKNARLKQARHLATVTSFVLPTLKGCQARGTKRAESRRKINWTAVNAARTGGPVDWHQFGG